VRNNLRESSVGAVHVFLIDYPVICCLFRAVNVVVNDGCSASANDPCLDVWLLIWIFWLAILNYYFSISNNFLMFWPHPWLLIVDLLAFSWALLLNNCPDLLRLLIDWGHAICWLIWPRLTVYCTKLKNKDFVVQWQTFFACLLSRSIQLCRFSCSSILLWNLFNF